MPRYSTELCRSRKLDGTRCKSFALDGKTLCHYHEVCGPVIDDALLPPDPSFLPVLHDATSIQGAITLICEHLLQGRIDSKKAGILLYACQVAASNVARLIRELPASSPSLLASDKDKNDASAGLPPGTIQASQQRKARISNRTI
jgi:hypothetical protein